MTLRALRFKVWGMLFSFRPRVANDGRRQKGWEGLRFMCTTMMSMDSLTMSKSLCRAPSSQLRIGSSLLVEAQRSHARWLRLCSSCKNSTIERVRPGRVVRNASLHSTAMSPSLSSSSREYRDPRWNVARTVPQNSYADCRYTTVLDIPADHLVRPSTWAIRDSSALADEERE